jgi:hypothetical protein
MNMRKLKQDKNGYIKATVEVPLMDLVSSGNIDGLNDTLEALVLKGQDTEAVLRGISTKIVGCVKGCSGYSGSVLVEVVAELVEI